LIIIKIFLPLYHQTKTISKMKKYQTLSNGAVTESEFIAIAEAKYREKSEEITRNSYARLIDGKKPNMDMRFVSKLSKSESQEKSLEFITNYLACQDLANAEVVMMQESAALRLRELVEGTKFIFKGGAKIYTVQQKVSDSEFRVIEGKKELLLNTVTTLNRSVILI
jgi:hypothetical protein